MRDNTTRRRFVTTASVLGAAGFAGCLGTNETGNGTTEAAMNDKMTDGGDEMTDGEDSMDDEMDDGMEPMDPADAERAAVDRFSEAAGTLHVRSGENDLPGPDEPIDFDDAFLHQGFGPDGEVIQYYDFDVQSLEPAPIYAFFREGEETPVDGQLNVVGVKPGDEGYNDFWRVNTVTVPASYEANQITSASSLMDTDYDVTTTDMLVNCPIVPHGSTAEKHAGDGDTTLVEGWYDGTVVSYVSFTESPLLASNDQVPLSPIYVTFNTNPGEDGGGPPSGFMTEDGSTQNHNVTATVPSDDSYSPLWVVNVYDNADFDDVSDLESAENATILDRGVANVNCPIVSVRTP